MDKGFTSTLKLNGWRCFPPERVSAQIPFNGKWQETIYPPPQPVLTEHSNLVLEETSWVNLSCNGPKARVFWSGHCMPFATQDESLPPPSWSGTESPDVSGGFGQWDFDGLFVKWTNGYGMIWMSMGFFSFQWDLFQIFLSEPNQSGHQRHFPLVRAASWTFWHWFQVASETRKTDRDAASNTFTSNCLCLINSRNDVDHEEHTYWIRTGI